MVSSRFCFVWFDSFRPINNLSVIKGRVLGWTCTKLGLMFLLKDTTLWRRWGANPGPLGLELSTLPLSHCTPVSSRLRHTLYKYCMFKTWFLMLRLPTCPFIAYIYRQVKIPAKWAVTWYFQQCDMCDQQTRSLIRAFACPLDILWILSYWPNINWSF